MVKCRDWKDPSFLLPMIAGLLVLSLSACATQRYGRMTPVSPGEHASLTCEQMELEIEKANFFVADVRRQRSQTTGAHVLGALGDFGIGNVMEGDAAEKSGTDRLDQLQVLSAQKGCEVNGHVAKLMTAEDLKAFVSDKTASGVNEKNRNWSVYYDPSGEIRAKSTGTQGTSYDSGTWSVTSEDIFCLQFKRWRDGKLRCWQVYNRNGTLIYIGKIGDTKNGVSDATWQSGNPESL